MQDIRARKTVARKVTIELGSVDVEVSAERCDGWILVREQAEIGAKHAAQLCWCRSRGTIQIFLCHPDPQRCLNGFCIRSYWSVWPL